LELLLSRPQLTLSPSELILGAVEISLGGLRCGRDGTRELDEQPKDRHQRKYMKKQPEAHMFPRRPLGFVRQANPAIARRANNSAPPGDESL
jgi:hypothetical protein